jgi:hypothetical protein
MNEESLNPKYSFWPIFLALSVLLVAAGLVSAVIVSLLGLLGLLVSLIGWAWENRSEGEEDDHEAN